MAAIANIGSSFVIALPPTEIWLTDEESGTKQGVYTHSLHCGAGDSELINSLKEIP
ncbi:hypothetical protein [Acinetobacter sp. 243_ASPC]|uniref:hypothetical protein n=1 Tax=Acinetobacter sp. 243_ASPC TaxID=1579345 RepID=UPI0013793856|nr:hypothetical protein [Acinetobacter sp. 243_ASPC]